MSRTKDGVIRYGTDELEAAEARQVRAA